MIQSAIPHPSKPQEIDSIEETISDPSPSAGDPSPAAAGGARGGARGKSVARGRGCSTSGRSFLGWTGRRTTTWFYPNKARYFRARDAVFMGGNVTLWMGMSLFMDENITFMDENVSLYG